MNISELVFPDTSLVFEPGAWHRVKKRKPINLPALWRSIAEEKGLSIEARLRLEWMLFHLAGNTPLKPVYILELYGVCFTNGKSYSKKVV